MYRNLKSVVIVQSGQNLDLIHVPKEDLKEINLPICTAITTPDFN